MSINNANFDIYIPLDLTYHQRTWDKGYNRSSLLCVSFHDNYLKDTNGKLSTRIYDIISYVPATPMYWVILHNSYATFELAAVIQTIYNVTIYRVLNYLLKDVEWIVFILSLKMFFGKISTPCWKICVQMKYCIVNRLWLKVTAVSLL